MDKLNNDIIEKHMYDTTHIKGLWTRAKEAGNRKDRLFKVITAVDNGEQWSIYKNKIRKSQSLPVSNVLSSIRDTRQGAMSTSGFVGEFVSESLAMDPYVTVLNDLFTNWWKRAQYDDVIDDTIENMLTLGTGAVLVSASHETAKPVGFETLVTNNIVMTAIDPSALYVEPGAKNEAEANYYFIKDTATYAYLDSIPMFKAGLEKNKSKIATYMTESSTGVEKLNSDFTGNEETKNADFITYIGRVKTPTGERWDMVWMFADVIIHKIEGITPNKRPIAFVREKRDKKSFWGQSTYKQNLAMQLSINELDSAVITHAKSQQEPPAFVSKTSGINIADYARNKDIPGATFPVNSTNVSPVTYAAKPNLPSEIQNMSTILTDRLEKNTGSSDISTGQGSGSLQTAGGISQVLGRASLKDLKVVNKIKKFYNDLYSIMLAHMELKKGIARYAAVDQAENETTYKTVNLADIDWTSVSIVVDLANHTNEAKQTNTQVISEMFQQSVQYSAAQPITEPVIMTADEYLLGLKEPNLHKLIDQIMTRRKKERELDMAQIVAQIIQLYLTLVADGNPPQEAIIHVAQEYSTDPGILKGMKVSEMAAQEQQAQAGSIDGGNAGQAQTGGAR